MAEAMQYGSGLYRLPPGYEFRRDPKKLGGKRRLCRRKSAARERRIAAQMQQRIASYNRGNLTALTPEQVRVLFGPPPPPKD